MRGVAAVQEALDIIGATEPSGDSLHNGDYQMAKIICDNEIAVRALVRFALERLADEL